MKISGESLLINALLNTQDVEAAKPYGITPAHFMGYTDEYKWLLNYLVNYQTQPSRDVFAAAFPDFTFSAHDDVRSAVDSLYETYYRKRMIANIDAAMKTMDEDLHAAHTLLTDGGPPRFTSSKPRSLVSDLNFFDNYMTNDSGIEVPIHTLQKHTGGISKGQLWYLGGRTGEGKSAYLCDWAASAIIQGYRVKFYSLEMDEMQLRGRIHAILAKRFGYTGITSLGIKHRTVDTHAYKQFVSELADRIEGVLHVHTPAEGFVTPGVINTTIDEYDLVIADHIGLVRPDGGGHSTDDWRVAARVSNAFKEMALATKTPILAAAQVNRDGASGSQPPDLKNLAGTDALGQDADVVVTLRAMSMDVATIFRLPKNRDGNAKMKWWCKFDPNNGDFREITQDMADEFQLEAENNE